MTLLLHSFVSPLRLRAVVGMLALLASFAGSTPVPARADGAASTRTIVLGAAAAVAGIIIYNNIHHKQVAHNTIVGRTRDGGVVYGDGHIVYPNGKVLYASNGNGRVCSYARGYGEPCGARPVAYYPSRAYADRARERDGDHDRGRHYGQSERGGNGNQERDDRAHGHRGHDD